MKKKTRALAVLAHGMTGVAMPPAEQVVIQELCRELGAVGLLVTWAFGEALQATGQTAQAQAMFAMVRRSTSAFG